MKFVFTSVLFFLFAYISVFAQTNPRHVTVNGYYRGNGTYVQPHHRTAPNSTNRDNFSTKPNVNPYTGEKGYVQPDNSPFPDYTNTRQITEVKPNKYKYSKSEYIYMIANKRETIKYDVVGDNVFQLTANYRVAATFKDDQLDTELLVTEDVSEFVRIRESCTKISEYKYENGRFIFEDAKCIAILEWENEKKLGSIYLIHK